MRTTDDLQGGPGGRVSSTGRRSSSRRSSSRRDWRGTWPPALAGASFLPILALHARELGRSPHERVALLALPGAAAIAWGATRRLGRLVPGDHLLVVPMAASIWLLLALAIVFVSPWCGAVAALLGLLAAAYSLGGNALAAAVLPAWAALWLAIPLPGELDEVMMTQLRGVVASWSIGLLDALHVEHIMTPDAVEVAGRRVPIDLTFGGLDSPLAPLLATALYLAWARVPGPKAAALLLASAFWGVAGGVLRVVAAVELATRRGVDASTGWRHALLGAVALLATLALIASTAALGRSAAAFLGMFRSPRKAGFEAEPDLRTGEPTSWPDLRRSPLSAPALGVFFGLLIAPQLALPMLVDDREGPLVVSAADRGAFARLNEETAPKTAGVYLRTGFSDASREAGGPWGGRSKAWRYTASSSGLVLSLDWPFAGWNDLLAPYRDQGWVVTPVRRTGKQAWNGAAVEAELADTEGRYGYLAFGLYDEQGAAIVPPGERGPAEVAGERLGRWRRVPMWLGLAAKAPDDAAPLHQIQVFARRVGAPLDRDEVRSARQVFDLARAAIHRATPATREKRP